MDDLEKIYDGVDALINHRGRKPGFRSFCVQLLQILMSDGKPLLPDLYIKTPSD